MHPELETHESVVKSPWIFWVSISSPNGSYCAWSKIQNTHIGINFWSINNFETSFPQIVTITNLTIIVGRRLLIEHLSSAQHPIWFNILWSSQFVIKMLHGGQSLSHWLVQHIFLVTKQSIIPIPNFKQLTTSILVHSNQQLASSSQTLSVMCHMYCMIHFSYSNCFTLTILEAKTWMCTSHLIGASN